MAKNKRSNRAIVRRQYTACLAYAIRDIFGLNVLLSKVPFSPPTSSMPVWPRLRIHCDLLIKPTSHQLRHPYRPRDVLQVLDYDGFKIINPSLDIGMDFGKEYQMAKTLHGKKQPICVVTVGERVIGLWLITDVRDLLDPMRVIAFFVSPSRKVRLLR